MFLMTKKQNKTHVEPEENEDSLIQEVFTGL